MSTSCESALSASPSSSAASTRREQRQGRSETVHVPAAPSVPSTTSTAPSSAMTSAGSSSTSSSSIASLPLHSPTSNSIQRQWQQRHSATVPVPTSSSTMASGPSSLPSSTMTSADVGSSSSSSIQALPTAATPVNAPAEPSFQDPALAERYWNYDHQKVSLSDAVAAERALEAAPGLVRRRLGSGEQPPWFWGQNSSAYVISLKSEDIEEEEENVCAICMEEYEECQLCCCILLRCFHSFHFSCLTQWWMHGLQAEQERTCPLCRSILPDLPIVVCPSEDSAYAGLTIKLI